MATEAEAAFYPLGMWWWTEAGAQTVGTLRALYRSGVDRWHQFWAEGPYAMRRSKVTSDGRSESQVA